MSDLDEDGYAALAKDMVELLIAFAVALGIVALLIWWLV